MFGSIKCLEHPTLKVPYENLNKRFRSAQKNIDREASHVTSAVNEIEKSFKDNDDGGVAQFPALLDQLLDRVTTLRKKTKESVVSEIEAAENCKKRLEHLKEGCDEVNTVSSSLWKKTRLDRMLVEHFLRSGYYSTAMKLAEHSQITELTNINIFLVAKEVEEALVVKDTSKCLVWCHDNKSKLRKLKSSLEFDIRLQEFIELVRAGMKEDAVRHARKHLANAEPELLVFVQRGMALLAFPPDTEIQPYKDMYCQTRWQDLIEQFRRENYRLFQLSHQSVFSAALQAGLSCLKTQKCSNRPLSDRNSECPVCQSLLHELATSLPFAHCARSRLICFISGKPLNEHNHPMMLPNGFVYGEEALRKMSNENDGQIVCPRTKEIYSFSEAEKIFVM